MRLIDEQYTRTPFYGSRRMVVWLNSVGWSVNRKRVRRLMQLMCIEAIYPKRKTTQGEPAHKKYPYLLSNVLITRPNQVWSTDITYVRLRQGFLYLVAVIDWYSRYVLSWELSNSMDIVFCMDALEAALRSGFRPEIFNSDQGSQFTSEEFTSRLKLAQVVISMDGRGRAMDNIFIERLWRTVKYEEIYLKDYGSPKEARQHIGAYFVFYNNQRPHQSLGYKTPREYYQI